MVAPSSGPRARGLGAIFLTGVLDLLGFGIVIPILPITSTRLHASAATTGLLLASYSFFQLLFSPFWGRVSDKIGRRSVIVLTSCGSAFAYLLYALAPSLSWLFLARSLGGVCAANISTAQAYVADVTGTETRSQAMATLNAGFAIGFTLGPAVAGFAVHLGGVRTPFLVAMLLSGLNALWSSVALMPTTPQTTIDRRPLALAVADAFRQFPLSFYLLIYWLVAFAFSNIESTLVLWTTSVLLFDERANAILFTVFGLSLVGIQLCLTRPLAKRVQNDHLLWVGVLLQGLGSASMLVVSTWWHMGLPTLLIAAGNSLSSPALMALLSITAPESRQGETLGVAQSVGALARIAGPAAGGAIFEHAGRHQPYVASAIVLSVALGLVSRWPRTKARQVGSGGE